MLNPAPDLELLPAAAGSSSPEAATEVVADFRKLQVSLEAMPNLLFL